MFYSHDVLTSRKYGVATVWLVATLGSKSSLKKVTRKAILDVDVQKACDTIVAPEAPMALRLQSNLLYGVSRVYAQQCGYVLSDAETAKNHMRLMFQLVNASSLDAEAGTKGREDQLMLQDDPNFFPDIDLVPFDPEGMALDISTIGSSQRSTLSPHNSQLANVGMSSPDDIGGLIIPPDDSSLIGGPVGGVGGFGMRGDSGAGSRTERQAFLDDDLGLAIDEDGNLQMTDAPPRQPSMPHVRGETTSVGGEQEQNNFQPSNDDGFMPVQDDFMFAPDDQEVFSPAQQPLEVQQITSEENAAAPVRRKARATAKALVLDTAMELRNGDLARWSAEYVINMQDSIRQKEVAKAVSLAKKNAEIWMLGERVVGPLSMFSGAELLEKLTGMRLGFAREKRPRDDSEDSETNRRVRARGESSADEVARGLEDDGYLPMIDDAIEQGREAPTPLDDRHVSSMMPWNQSAGSQRRTGLYSGQGFPTSASIGGGFEQMGLISRRASRLTSASPLIGRGVLQGENDDFQLLSSQGGMEGLDEFELFGPAAGVDTQTAEMSQWQRTVLNGESVHFLEFVQTGIREMDDGRNQAEPRDEDDVALRGSIDFDILLPPETHSYVVAAQALLHVLALGTRNVLAIEQSEAFGPITLRTRSTA